MVVLFDVISAVWVGAFVGVLMKVASPHENWVSWAFSALVGGLGAIVGLFVARYLGVSREDDLRTLAIAGGVAVMIMCGYVVVSRAAVRRLHRRSGRRTRPTIAF